MLFNSYIFIFAFLPITYFIFWFLKKRSTKLSYAFLIIASFVFYGYQNPKFTLILLSSILVNYSLYLFFKNPNRDSITRKSLFVLGLIFNLGILGYFKYLNFFIDNVNNLLGLNISIRSILLPLGISFYTFQQVSFIIDAYKGNIPEYTFLEYALFVSFFPQLIAGPIVLHNEIIPQLRKNKDITRPSYEDLYIGIQFFIFGFIKKVLIADFLGRGVDWGYNNILFLNSLSALFIILAYTLQIYFDFSGYCDMAIGLGRLFGITICQNFSSPYKALSISDFWKRWHITLTRFLTTYIYIPLGGNRRGIARTYLNILIVFLVSGLWHGADWSFVLWGFIHGLFMVFERMLGQNKMDKIPKIIRWIYSFSIVNLLWILFRAQTFTDATNILKRVLHGGSGLVLPEITDAMFCIISNNYLQNIILLIELILLVLLLLWKNSTDIINMNIIKPVYVVFLGLLFVIAIINLSSVSTFLYFNF